VRQYWQPTIIIDQFEHFQGPFGGINAFMTQHAVINGMSGGPVFNIEGRVIGMSVGTSNRKVPQNDGEMRLDNGIVAKIISFKELIKTIL
jgi:S1-C subfamily serine protease